MEVYAAAIEQIVSICSIVEDKYINWNEQSINIPIIGMMKILESRIPINYSIFYCRRCCYSLISSSF